MECFRLISVCCSTARLSSWIKLPRCVVAARGILLTRRSLLSIVLDYRLSPNSAASSPKSSAGCRWWPRSRRRSMPIWRAPNGCVRPSSSARSPASWCRKTRTTSRPAVLLERLCAARAGPSPRCLATRAIHARPRQAFTMSSRHRRSIRLPGYDTRQPGPISSPCARTTAPIFLETLSMMPCDSTHAARL